MKHPIAVEAVQRRTVRTLVAAQIIGGLGVGSGVAVGALLASSVLGRPDLAGLVQSAQVLGSALLAIPAAALAIRVGRRAGLAMALAIAAMGGVVAVVAAETRLFPLLLLGMALFGGGTTAGLQGRYAAVDLAEPERRGRTLSVVVWATTIGAVAGPNLVGPGGRFGEWIGIEPLAGPLVLGSAAMSLAVVVVWLGLRPDPLALARTLAAGEAGALPEPPASATGRPRGTLRRGLSAVRASRNAAIALGAIVVAHTTMVSVMAMTPIHMDHGHASLEIIGFVISIHVAGMFAFSPIMGWLADRLGRIPVIVAGMTVLLGSVVLSGTAPEGHSSGLTAGLFLLGVGWSACLVAGSTLLTESVAVAERPVVQGASDLMMGLAAAGGGALAGVVVGQLGFGVLNVGAAGLAVAFLVALAAARTRPVTSVSQ